MSSSAENPIDPTLATGRVSSGTEPSTDGVDSLLIPRWIVYFQGALLGVVAATFFIFGLMVGNLTSGANSIAEQKINVKISGEVVFLRSGREVSDVDAVVMFLPVDKKPDQRSDASAVHPDSFEPLGNVGIDRVNGVGGAVVRVDKRGFYSVVVDGPQEYYVIVVSAHRQPESAPTMAKRQKAVLATFFKPVEDVVGGQDFYWTTVDAVRDKIEIGKIVFE